jgi:hypothetical protein
MSGSNFLGVFLNPYFAQEEGVDRVLDRLCSWGVSALVTHPHVARPVEEGKGVRFPPLHVDGFKRILGRSLWGKRELYLETFWSFHPREQLYGDGPYRSVWRPIPEGIDPHTVRALLQGAGRRGMKAYLQLGPFLPPSLRTRDIPVLVDGKRYRDKRVAAAACLNSPDAQRYALALVEDVLEQYPESEGLILDWIEFGAYHLEEHFSCFCAHCAARAEIMGLEWEPMRRDVGRLWDWLHALNPRELQRSRRVVTSLSEMLELLQQRPGILQFLKFKADTVTGFYRKVKELIDRKRPRGVELVARGWPPPWNRSSGTDYRALAEICQTVTPKLFTFDYSALPRWYGESIGDWNPDLPESDIIEALLDWMNLPDDMGERRLDMYRIPAPTEPHPARIECYRGRLEEVAAQVDGKAHFRPFAHAYLPESQWRRMLELIRGIGPDGLWVQMYGYLNDEKARLLREIWAQERV